MSKKEEEEESVHTLQKVPYESPGWPFSYAITYIRNYDCIFISSGWHKAIYDSVFAKRVRFGHLKMIVVLSGNYVRNYQHNYGYNFVRKRPSRSFVKPSTDI